MLGRLFKKKHAAPEPKPLRPSDSERLYVVGDIHGRFDLLRLLMKVLARDFDAVPDDGRSPRLVFLGDYVDRGDNSRDVLETMIRLGENAVFLKGNHEAALLGFLEAPERNKSWLRYGGLQTLASYGVKVPNLDAGEATLFDAAVELRNRMGPHVEFLQEMPVVYRSGDVVCVHAGLDPANPDSTSEDALLWGRSGFIEAGGVAGVCVIHGHYDDPEPVVTRNRICVDTGAYYSGRLTAARIDDQVRILTADILDAA